jgi:hypothetical protein
MVVFLRWLVVFQVELSLTPNVPLLSSGSCLYSVFVCSPSGVLNYYQVCGIGTSIGIVAGPGFCSTYYIPRVCAVVWISSKPRLSSDRIDRVSITKSCQGTPETECQGKRGFE